MKPANAAGASCESLSTHTATENPVTARFDRQNLHPRLLFHDRLASAMEQASRDGGRVALACLKASDWPAGMTGLPYGRRGNCFVIVEVPERHVGDIAEMVRGKLGSTDANLGVAVYPDDALDPEHLCSAAAAARGRTRVTVVGPGERPDNEQLVLYYQPQVELAGGHVFGAEALARFSDGSRTRREASGRVLHVPGGMDESFVFWALERAVAELGDWRRRGLPDVRLAVNLPLELAESADLPRRIGHLLVASAVPPECLEIELTEQRPSLNLDAVAGVFKTLRAMGLRLALDDFGTGFASLSLLERLPFDTLKIDIQFIAGLGARDQEVRDDRERIVGDIIGLARQRGLTVIAEGVERPAQLAALRRLGCDACQGYLFSPPVPGDALADILTAGLTLPA